MAVDSHDTAILYKYYIPKRVIVKNVTQSNMIIKQGEAKVDNHIPSVDIFYYRPLRNVISILLYQTFNKELKTNDTHLLCYACYFFFLPPP